MVFPIAVFLFVLCQKKQQKGGKSAISGDGMIKITSLKGAPAGIDAEVSRRDSRGHWRFKSYMDGFPDVVDPVFPERVFLWESKSGLFGGYQLSYRKLPLKSAIRSPESYHKMGRCCLVTPRIIHLYELITNDILMIYQWIWYEYV